MTLVVITWVMITEVVITGVISGCRIIIIPEERGKLFPPFAPSPPGKSCSGAVQMYAVRH